MGLRGSAPGSDFEEFASVSWPRLRHAGWLLTGHDQDAEDLAQVALAKTYAAWDRVRRSDAYAFARRCMVNANIDRHRRRRLREVSTDVLPDRACVVDLDVTDPVAQRARLAELLAVLSDRERRVVVLRYYFDLSESAVAGDLGVSVGTVKSTASRALAKMRVAEVEPGAASPRSRPFVEGVRHVAR
ncbi:MAG TPA: SigE family RNA polymerase sigma factor [Nocardioidaceae bacterium]|nr:SigE family RNA polymerase sigma factor [Nocardioidaceae bacterium]